jgi:hypothetical protein
MIESNPKSLPKLSLHTRLETKAPSQSGPGNRNERQTAKPSLSPPYLESGERIDPLLDTLERAINIVLSRFLDNTHGELRDTQDSWRELFSGKQ